MIRVIAALIMRETKTRYGKSSFFGYAFVVIEPLGHILCFTALYTAMNRTPPVGESLFLFLVTGILPYFLFRDLCVNVMNAVSANRALLEYPPVKHIDVIVARILLEVLTYSTIMLAFIPVLYFFGLPILPDNPSLFLTGFMLLIGLGAGFGATLVPLSTLYPFVAKGVAWLLRLTYFLSGALYAVVQLPPDLMFMFEYNPVAQVIDVIRAGFYFGYESRIASLPALTFIVFSLVSIGFSLEFLLRREMTRA
jgi:capsular polysaccharide transport system permease protein